MLRECECRVPNEHVDPRYKGQCVRCGFNIPLQWSDTRPFFDRLERAFAHDINARPAIIDMRSEADARTLAGQSKFGYAHLGRNNPLEGCQEAADGANYSAYHIIGQERRGEDPEWPLALTAAFHFASAHAALRALRDRHHLPISEQS